MGGRDSSALKFERDESRDAFERRDMPAWFYMLRLTSGKLYSGSSRVLPSRIKQHFQGRGGRTTRLDPPKTVAYTEEFGSYREASQREARVKGWSRAKKEALIRGDIQTLKKLARRKA